MPEDYARETDDMLAELKRLQAEGKLLALPELTAAVLALGERLKALEARVARLEERGNA